MKFTNLQEACDYAVAKIVEQGKRCTINGTCSYGYFAEGKPAEHCAMGWLIPEEYPPGHSIWDHKGPATVLLEDFFDEDVWPDFFDTRRAGDVLEILQEFHDNTGQWARNNCLRRLRDEGIDTIAPQYTAWVCLGASD